ncbi:MAG: aminoacetone oxidase family FAD-binding enzyme, partial [Verrucomicrobia bacterium]|nr:aminoacetone oxidase family FAD-binding enzyme [Verrucomicrobiota bacterium]
VPPVPSLFTFHVELPWVRSMAGLTVTEVEVSVPDLHLKEKGPLLFTHQGVSGPAILRLSAWGARPLHEKNYRFPLQIKWLPRLTQAEILQEIQARRETQGAQMVMRAKWNPLPSRLWEQLATHAGITAEDRWSKLPRESGIRLAQTLQATELPVSGKSMNKEEFVTCGGIPLQEVDLKTMQSRLVPGLYFAGEALDIDGVTGGFNFQAAWTTGWIAGQSMA